MKIMVFNVPAEMGGALAILEDFHAKVIAESPPDVEWYFVVSMPDLKETDNVHILRFPWVKKSHFHRVYFDYVIAPRLIKKFQIDQSYSQHNQLIPRTKVFQTLYIQQSIPFSDLKFTWKEDPNLWVSKNIVGKRMLQSIKKAKRVIFQSHWVKDRSVEMLNTDPEIAHVIHPEINPEIHAYKHQETQTDEVFFYPASSSSYKNHRVIFEAAMKLKQKNIHNFEVVMTIEGNERSELAEMKELAQANGLKFHFVGNLPREEVYDYYTKSTLLFPTYLEAFGMPMLEARLIDTPIIVSDRPFSREVLGDYEKVAFFECNDAATLARLMQKRIEKQPLLNENKGNSFEYTHTDILKVLLNG